MKRIRPIGGSKGQSVLMGVRVLPPTDEGEDSSRFDPFMLKEAMRIKIVEEVVLPEPDLVKPAKGSTKAKKSQHKLPFSVDPATLASLKLEDLKAICIDEYLASIPEGKEIEESDFPDPQTKEAAIAYASSNFGK